MGHKVLYSKTGISLESHAETQNFQLDVWSMPVNPSTQGIETGVQSLPQLQLVVSPSIPRKTLSQKSQTQEITIRCKGALWRKTVFEAVRGQQSLANAEGIHLNFTTGYTHPIHSSSAFFAKKAFFSFPSLRQNSVCIPNWLWTWNITTSTFWIMVQMSISAYDLWHCGQWAVGR